MPPPWNHLEAGILFGLRLPLLSFREKEIEGGVFDRGVSDVFIHDMPAPGDNAAQKAGLGDVFLKWQAEVRRHYYEAWIRLSPLSVWEGEVGSDVTMGRCKKPPNVLDSHQAWKHAQLLATFASLCLSEGLSNPRPAACRRRQVRRGLAPATRRPASASR